MRDNMWSSIDSSPLRGITFHFFSLDNIKQFSCSNFFQLNLLTYFIGHNNLISICCSTFFQAPPLLAHLSYTNWRQGILDLDLPTDTRTSSFIRTTLPIQRILCTTSMSLNRMPKLSPIRTVPNILRGTFFSNTLKAAALMLKTVQHLRHKEARNRWASCRVLILDKQAIKL